MPTKTSMWLAPRTPHWFILSLAKNGTLRWHKTVSSEEAATSAEHASANSANLTLTIDADANLLLSGLGFYSVVYDGIAIHKSAVIGLTSARPALRSASLDSTDYEWLPQRLASADGEGNVVLVGWQDNPNVVPGVPALRLHQIAADGAIGKRLTPLLVRRSRGTGLWAPDTFARPSVVVHDVERDATGNLVVMCTVQGILEIGSADSKA